MQAEAMPCAPQGLLSPRLGTADEGGAVRWYAAYAGEGREAALAARKRAIHIPNKK